MDFSRNFFFRQCGLSRKISFINLDFHEFFFYYFCRLVEPYLKSKAELIRPLRSQFVNASAVALLSFLFLLNLTQVCNLYCIKIHIFFSQVSLGLYSLRGHCWSLSFEWRLFCDGSGCRLCSWPFRSSTLYKPFEGKFLY